MPHRPNPEPDFTSIATTTVQLSELPHFIVYRQLGGSRTLYKATVYHNIV